MSKLMIAIAAGMLFASSAYAADVTGEWAATDGKSKVRFSACGAALCGALSWVKDTNGPGKVGQRIFYDMKPSGEGSWSGRAFNPEDGKEYSGKMTLSGNELTTAGCLFGGMLCKSLQWTRVH